MQIIIHFALRCYIQNPDTLRHIFILKKIHFELGFISKFYRIVLMPKYKRTYDHSNHIEK